jgi:hypothetical protein
MYRILVDGVLGDWFATAFDAFRVEREEGCTALSGICVDSSAVFGVLERVKALGLGLLEVESFATAIPSRRPDGPADRVS